VRDLGGRRDHGARAGATTWRAYAFQVVFWSSVGAVVVWLLAAVVAWLAAAVPPVHETFHRWGPTTEQVTLSYDEEFDEFLDEQGAPVPELVIAASDEIVVRLAAGIDPDGAPLTLYPGQVEGSAAAVTAQVGEEGREHRFRAPEPGAYLLSSDFLSLPVYVVAGTQAGPALPPALATAVQRAASVSHLGGLFQGAGVQYLFSVMELALAIFLIRVRPRDPAAWLLGLGLLGTAAVFNLPAHAGFLVLEPLLGFSVLETLHGWGFHLVGGAAYVGALLVFPDGRLPRWSSRRTRGLILRVLSLALFAALSYSVVLAVTIYAEEPLGRLGFFGVLIPVVGILAQAIRYRHASDETQRQQSRVLMLALGAALAVTLLAGAILWTLARAGPSPALDLIDRLGFEVFPPLFAVIPVVLVAVLVRYRLWDMDRVLNRALVYSVVSAILGIGYLAIVVLLGPYVPGGQSSPLAVALATLALAGLFRPLRARIQVAVDRRFYRQRYDAAECVRSFSARLREHVDLDTLTTELITVVDDTVQPATSFLWLRPLEETRHEGMGP